MLHHFFAADSGQRPWIHTIELDHSYGERLIEHDIDWPKHTQRIAVMLFRLGAHGSHYVAVDDGGTVNGKYWVDLTGSAYTVDHDYYPLSDPKLRIPPGLIPPGGRALLLVLTANAETIEPYFGGVASQLTSPYYFAVLPGGSPSRRVATAAMHGSWFYNVGTPPIFNGQMGYEGPSAKNGSLVVTIESQGDGIWTGTYTGNSQANRNIGCPFKPRLMIFTDRSNNQAFLCPMYRGRIFSVLRHLHIPDENYVNEDGVLLRTSYLNISGRNYTVTAYRGE